MRLPATRFLAVFWLCLALMVPAARPAVSETPGDGVVLHVFWSVTCPVCLSQKPWIAQLEKRFPGLQVVEMELSGSERHHARFRAMTEARSARADFVPTLILGPRVWVGDGPSLRGEIEAAIAAALAGGALLPEGRGTLRLPLAGEIEVATASILGVTAMIAFVDGFNPCSLWVLTLLLGMVVSTRSRRRVAVVGISFLLTTALIYGAFIAGVFGVLAFAFALPWVRWAVALLALVFGLASIRDYFGSGRGFSFAIPETRKPGIYQRLRRLRQEDMGTPALIAATVAMAAGIALVELPCTAGFPVIWSGILAERGIGGASFAALLAVYVLIYLAIELTVFAVAVTGMNLGRMGEGHGRVLKLLGGSVMVALAGALALRPELMEDLTGTALLLAAALGIAGLVIVLRRVRLLR